jgi:hypothetical protein
VPWHSGGCRRFFITRRNPPDPVHLIDPPPPPPQARLRSASTADMAECHSSRTVPQEGHFCLYSRSLLPLRAFLSHERLLSASPSSWRHDFWVLSSQCSGDGRVPFVTNGDVCCFEVEVPRGMAEAQAKYTLGFDLLDPRYKGQRDLLT